MESMEGDEGRVEMEVSSSRAFSIAQMVSSRRVVAALKSRSALSRMVDMFSGELFDRVNWGLWWLEFCVGVGQWASA